ncbi:MULTISPECIES: hypothetical protein [unclassified Streptomyces]|uniref:hypothetical protein n=1 Tax=unclassified Streptomyces TaxID=2593676 RepID=UPI001BEC4F26|nr:MULTISPECIES: hypothetical protein [unclassified Streptomyces]MBT2427909.1 hypothetical protein [Streptomyces sp. ISL-112]MBT2464580.1 hypothetical protein [Streptomyces sp. ISL-63]
MGGEGEGEESAARRQGIDVAPSVDADVDVDEAIVGASVVGGPCGAVDPVADPSDPGTVLLGVGGSVGVPAGGGGAGDG